MADAVESYYLRFWKRFRRDATPWARDNILWGIVVLIVPPLAIYLRDHHAQIDWGVIKSALLLYASTFAIYILVHLHRTARKLDEEREVSEKLLSNKIAEQAETIRKITSKPQRTSAEQHHYDMAKKALQKLGPETALALRHLKTQGRVTFGTYSPFLPPGISVDRLVNIYIECLREGLVTKCDDSQKGERTFEIAPTMNSILDELLYEDNGSTSVG